MEPRDPFCYCDRLASNSIRLLHVIPDDDDAPIVCKLRDYVFHSIFIHRLAYSALSYTWGNESKTERVICNGKDLFITKNLYNALWRIRKSKDNGLWWVDAICINQADIIEKTTQVRKMMEIYSRSWRVVAWLGEEEPDTKDVIELMHKLSNLMSGPLMPKPESNMDLDTQAFGLPPATDDLWVRLFKLLGRPWFRRVWIVQEIVAAPRGIFMCGSHIIPLRVIFSVSMTIIQFHNIQWARIISGNDYNDRLAQAPTAAILESFRKCRRSGIKLEIAHLMQTTKVFDSSDPRDKVFALVGLSSDVPVQFIDYSKSLQSIHIDVIKTTLCDATKFDYLSEVCHNRSVQGLPSWVPELSYHSMGFVPLRFVFKHDHEAIVDKPVFHWNSENGKIIDHVEEIIDDAPHEASNRQIFELHSTFQPHMTSLHVWVKKCENLLESESRYIDGSPVSEAFWKAFIFETGRHNVRATESLYPAYQAYRQLLQLFVDGTYERTPAEQRRYEILSSGRAFRRDIALTSGAIACPTSYLATSLITGKWPRGMFSWMRTITMGLMMLGAMHLLMLRCPYAVTKQDEDAEDIDTKIDELAAQCRPLEYSIMMFTNRRRFFVSGRKVIGWVPRNTQKGDKICIFQGCRIPFVIREVQDGFQLLGDCYMQGMMDGEAWISSSARVEEIKLV